MTSHKYLTWLHGTGVMLSVGALVIGGLHNPALGFPVVIAILISLEIPSSPKPADKGALSMIYGSIRRGGIRRGTFIREMFGVAVTYSAIINFTSGMTIAGFSNALLAAALIISSIASEIEAHSIRKIISVT